MWPAEGAVGQFVVPFFARYGLRWIATDQGVFARSGRYGYRVDDPNVLCQPYRVEEGQSAVSVFFRNTRLSDDIGFRYHGYSDYKEASTDFLNQIKALARQFKEEADRVLTVILDGENAWGEYREDARPFLHALYALLEEDDEIQTVTFSEFLGGNAIRGIVPHPLEEQTKVYDLFIGSWIDENSSSPGVDLGTWIGEKEENRGWELLAQARSVLGETKATPEGAPESFQALYMAEGSDWFWWFGADQDSGNDEEFDDLFRIHLKNVYHGLGREPPEELDRHIVPHVVPWSFTNPVKRIQPGDRLSVRTNCPGILTWRADEGQEQATQLALVGGVMAGIQRYQVTLGPFKPEQRILRFRFRCTHRDCDSSGICCKQELFAVEIKASSGAD
jgi:alpha-amylase/alpha-mannosidase (GH57 family)